MHNNADGLSRSRATLSADTPPDDQIALEEASIHTPSAELQAALLALEDDPHLDGDAPCVFVEDVSLPPTIGPRQLLLESAPCH